MLKLQNLLAALFMQAKQLHVHFSTSSLIFKFYR